MAVSRTSWKPGEAPRQPGRKPGPILPLEVRQLKDCAKAEVIAAISKGLMMTKDDMAKMMNDPNATMAQMAAGAVILAAIKHGDIHRFGTLINYVLGKPKPLGSSWHDDLPSENGPSASPSLQAVPSSALIEIMRRSREIANGDGSSGIPDP